MQDLISVQNIKCVLFLSGDEAPSVILGGIKSIDGECNFDVSTLIGATICTQTTIGMP